MAPLRQQSCKTMFMTLPTSPLFLDLQSEVLAGPEDGVKSVTHEEVGYIPKELLEFSSLYTEMCRNGYEDCGITVEGK